MNTFKRNKGGWCYRAENGMCIMNMAKRDVDVAKGWWLYDASEELVGKYKTLREAKEAAQ